MPPEFIKVEKLNYFKHYPSALEAMEYTLKIIQGKSVDELEFAIWLDEEGFIEFQKKSRKWGLKNVFTRF